MPSPYQAVPTAPGALAPEGYGAVPGIAPGTVPFDQASHIVVEEGPVWSANEIKAEAQILETKNIPANGFLRNLWVEVENEVAGEEGGAEEKESEAGKFPFTVLSRLEFFDQGGHTISSLSGWNWYLADKYGGYAQVTDPKEWPTFSATKKSFAFTLLIPLELCPTGFGALTNMTEATKYQLQPTIATEKTSLEKPKKAAKFKIRTWCDLWILPEAMTQPEPGFPQGRPQIQRPPLEGTIQFWTEQSGIKVNAGQQQVLLTRMGQMIRTHIFVGYNEARSKLKNVLPTTTQILWARVIFKVLSRNIWITLAKSYLPGLSSAIETGVYPLPYSYGERRMVGGNEVNSWIPTVNSTRYELSGEWEAGQIDILTNDVAVAAVSEVGRREVPGQTSYHAPRGVE